MNYTVTTTGDAGNSTFESGTITALPPSGQVLTSTSNNNQTVIKGNAITPITLTWSGEAEDANVTGLPTGVTFVKDTNAKTITISGTPTATGTTTFTALTSGSTGTPVALSGTIKVKILLTGDVIHNFTLDGSTSTFYNISGNALATNRGTMTYGDLTLTKCLKLETSAGVIEFDTDQPSTLTLVMNASSNSTFVAGANAKIDDKSPTDASGVLVVSLDAGHHVIKKSLTGNIFYIKLSFTTLGLGENTQAPKLTLYPNPVTNSLHLSSSDHKIENIAIYSTTGALVKSVTNEIESIDVSNLNSGSYIVKVTTEQGSFTQKIIKK
jgi:hypothetical protein